MDFAYYIFASLSSAFTGDGWSEHVVDGDSVETPSFANGLWVRNLNRGHAGLMPPLERRPRPDNMFCADRHTKFLSGGQ
ncbi:hypothetical protein NL676_037353 [Syzygium grande]|nr:hypothetical protein NL676_037353 [Syzygium grande]